MLERGKFTIAVTRGRSLSNDGSSSSATIAASNFQPPQPPAEHRHVGVIATEDINDVVNQEFFRWHAVIKSIFAQTQITKNMSDIAFIRQVETGLFAMCCTLHSGFNCWRRSHWPTGVMAGRLWRKGSLQVKTAAHARCGRAIAKKWRRRRRRSDACRQ